MTYEDAVAYLESLENFEQHHDAQAMRALHLERMRRFCQRLGDPQRRFRSVLVTGTNGKGSICAMLYSMLRESALRAGLYTSPHVEHVRERVRVWTAGAEAGVRVHGDDWITEAEFASLVAQLQPVVEDFRRDTTGPPLTYFEVMTAMAFMQFAQHRVEVAVLETGLGGRLDATNVVEQAVSVIAPIDVDHADVLGDDPVAIAREKAGIVKPHQLVLTAAQSDAVLDVLRAACEREGVPLMRSGRDVTARVHAHSLSGLRLAITGLRGIYEALELPLIGRHQAENAALAVGALETLSPTGVPRSLVEQGLARVSWPGRLEVVHEQPLVLLDGAHNPHAVQALAMTLRELCPKRRMHLLIGMSADKSVEAIGQILGSVVVSATCTKSRHPRALDPTALAKRFSPFCHDVHVMSDPIDAYTYLFNAVSSHDAMVVTGSFFLVGELRASLRHAHLVAKRQDSHRAPADVAVGA